jgi:hypothetical protein
MSPKPTAYAALAVMFVATPCWAMSVQTVPANRLGAPQFNDPASTPHSPFSGSIQTFSTQTSGSFGFGGSTSLSIGTSRFSGRTAPDAPFSILNPRFPNSMPGFPDSNLGFSNVPPAGSNLTDPNFGPYGAYAPGLRDSGR